MDKTDCTRRRLLAFAVALPFVARAGAAMAEDTCDANNVPAAQKSMRATLGYLPVSDDPAKVCGGCAFFTAGQPQTCGACRLLGGPVSAGARCDSWAARH